MGSFIALRKTFDLSSDNNSHLLCGRQNRDIPVVPEGGAVMTTLKKHYVFTVNVSFNSNGGTTCSAQSYTIGRTYKSLPTPTRTQHIFLGWYTQINGGSLVSDSSMVESSITVLYAHWEEVNITGSYTVDLNNQWRQSPSQSNPDSSMYDGVYESNSNYNVNSDWAKMYVRIKGYETFSLYIRSYAESTFDYTLAFNLDVDVTSNPSVTTRGVKESTSGKQQSGQAIENYTKVIYTGIGGGSHFICIVYRKDSSTSTGNDRGYVLIPKEQ